MLYEFAVEPACIGDWKDFRYLIENLGVSHGRLLSEYPKDWRRRVYEACNAFTFRQKQQLEIQLERLKKQVLIPSGGRTYKGELKWVENAVQQHRDGKPFHAIIAKDRTDQPDFVIGVDDLSSELPVWKTLREKKILRNATDLGNSVQLLLRMSNRILFIDKMFQPAEERWSKTLMHFIKIAIDGREKTPELEYHFEIDSASIGMSKDDREKNFQDICERFLIDDLPLGMHIRLNRWTKWDDKSDFFHARYILTERGGVRIDWGLDTGKLKERTDVTLLDDNMWKETWDLFQFDSETGKPTSKAFQWIDSIAVEGETDPS